MAAGATAAGNPRSKVVACPVCGAEKDQPCVGSHEWYWVHLGRDDAWLALAPNGSSVTP